MDPKEMSITATEERLNRFRQGIRFRTISKQPEGEVDHSVFREPSSPDELLKQLQFIENQYPTFHRSPFVQYETVNKYSRLYTIQGKNRDLLPYLLASHMDVVPVDEEKWDHDPFEAKIVDGEIYGRGTLDMKATLYSIMEAFEYLFNKGFQPQRTVYLAFGHDEEIGGHQGARKIADLLKERGVQLEFVLDEGTGIVHNVLPGLDPSQYIALVAVAEKGYATLELSVSMPGGHSSVPLKESSIGVLARAVTKLPGKVSVKSLMKSVDIYPVRSLRSLSHIARLEDNPQPCMFGYGPEVAMLRFAAPKMSFFLRTIMNNLWLFGGLIKRIFARNRATDALQRTTTAITMFNAGVKSNVIAQDAVAKVNHRIHPSQTLEQVIEHDRRVINDDRVEIKLIEKMDVGKMAPFDDQAFGFQTIKDSVARVYPSAIVAPNLLMANTDSRFYEPFSKGVYKFMPWVGTTKIAELIHGNNERIGVTTYENYMNFYLNVILLADRESL